MKKKLLLDTHTLIWLEEEQFKHKLLELGLLTEIKNPLSKVPIGEQPLAQIQGKPLSQLIIEERR
jgi:PIN domain nuclease of toxin-antitoxin system